MRTLLLSGLLLAACHESALVRIGQAQVPLSSANLKVRPAGTRSYRLKVSHSASVRRRGPGAGGIQQNVFFQVGVKRSDTPAGTGVRSVFQFHNVQVKSAGASAGAFARAAHALNGAKVTINVDERGRVQQIEPAPGAGKLAAALARTLSGLPPSLADGTKGPGARWSENARMTLPVGPTGKTLPMSMQASYVFHGTGEVSGKRCVLIHATLQGKANAPAGPRSALKADGRGRAQLCLEPETGALRAVNLSVTVRGAVGLRTRPGGPVPLHLDQIIRLRVSAEQIGSAG